MLTELQSGLMFWCFMCLRVFCGAWRHFQSPLLPTAFHTLTALVYRGYCPGPTSVMLHPGRVVETSERQPCVVGVVVVNVVNVVSVSSRVQHSDKCQKCVQKSLKKFKSEKCLKNLQKCEHVKCKKM